MGHRSSNKDKDKDKGKARKPSKKATPPASSPPAADIDDIVVSEIPADDPGSPRLGGGALGMAPSVGSGIIEVQFRPDESGLAAALAADAQGFLANAAMNAAATGSSIGPVQEVLLRHNVQASAPSFSPRHIQAEASRLSAAAAAGGMAPLDAVADHPPLQSFVRFQFATPEEAAEAARALQALPEVEKALPVPDAAPPNMKPLPTDPFIGSPEQGVQQDPTTKLEPQWYLHRTSVPDAWELGARGAGVVIADIDWGYRVSHRELQPRLEMANAYNAVDGSNNVSQGQHTSHGTAVLGIVGAAADGRGMAGYAPEATLWPVQGNTGAGPAISHDPWADAIEHVRLTDRGGRRKVIILEVQTGTFGNYEQIPSVNAAIRRAIADNIVVCVAAGNGDRAADIADDNVTHIDPTGSILVGATAWHPTEDRRASFSNWGARIVVSAPGDPEHDLTCSPTADNAYRNGFGGTSGATPKVAGVAALMLSANPRLTHDDVREILRGTGAEIVPDPAAPEKRVGVFLNAEAAVREALRRAGSVDAGMAATPASVHIEGLDRRAPVSKRRSIEPTPAPLALGAEAAVPAPPALDRTLREFRQSTQGLMTREQQLLVVDQAIQLLELFYVHRPLKEAMHAVRPIQRLRVLRHRLEEEPQAWTAREELRLHNLLTDIFTSVRDLHTNYLLPQPYRDYTAFLPFLVRPYYESDGRRRYMVTQVLPGFTFANPNFGPHVEVLSWNGVAIDAAVELNAQQTAGSNLAARYVRGVDALTLRPMNVALPPDADWVHVTFRRDDGPEHEMRQDWLVRFTPIDEASASGGSVLTWEPDRLFGAAAGPVGTPVTAMSALGNTGAAPPNLAESRTIQDETAFSLDVPGAAYSMAQELIFSQPAPPAVAAVSPATPAPAPALAPATTSPALPDPRTLEYLASLGIDVSADAVRVVKQVLFSPENVMAAGERALSPLPEAGPHAGLHSGGDLPSQMPLIFKACRLTIGGRDYAYVRIRTFAVTDPDAFVQEFIRLIEQLPQDGLILDVRGNGGGHIFAAERLLQTLTPSRIEPERLQFISTPGTLELCRRNKNSSINLSPWLDSLEQAVLTGATYSQALPITEPESCNVIGQRYHGPIVLLVDGRCYSATDIFAAGFQDHGISDQGIGLIVGTSHNTGAGGANVWGHNLLHLLYSGQGSPLKPLPHKMGMRIAIRQTLRVGTRAGTLLEDFGVSPAPDRIHNITRRDLMEDDADLMEFAAGLLATQPVYRLKVKETGRGSGLAEFEVDLQGIKRLDFYLNGHPAKSVSITPGNPPPTFKVMPGTRVELRGFAVDSSTGNDPCVAALKHMVP